jgi:2'-5' RNA ligase
MPPPGSKQYLIAIIPPAPLYDEALRWKEYMRDHYNSKAALKSPPHITLHMPFEWKEEKQDKLIHALQKFSAGRPAFTIQLKNFNCFAPRVIFIDVVPQPLLQELAQALHRFCKEKLNLFNARYLDKPFHPHLTIAFRDLKPALFQMAWGEIQDKEFEGAFAVDKISLLKHNGKVWESLQDFFF